MKFMQFLKQNCQAFLAVFLLGVFLLVPNFTTKAAGIDEPGAREITYWELVHINKQLPTASVVSLKLGDYLNLKSAEELLGEAIDSSGQVKQGNLRIEQITFEHGIITTREYKIWSIRFTGGKTLSNVYPRIDRGGISIGNDESYIRKIFGTPQKVNTLIPNHKTLVYTNEQNYAEFDINESTHKVEAFEIGLLQ